VIIIVVFQFDQRAIENRSACHAWHLCRRLPTPALYKQTDYVDGNRILDQSPQVMTDFTF
jgi:hypothetical protein